MRYQLALFSELAEMSDGDLLKFAYDGATIDIPGILMVESLISSPSKQQ